jgi:2-polyprenyl-3-methyl-5-hydroxy-6-metoxy-1,4-benzoquinol methylase
VVENYIRDKKKQTASAEKYKDQIKRVYYQEDVDKETRKMLQDDIRRLKLIKEFSYGKNVLEVGCSDGTVSLKIAELPQVKKVLGIDIRKSAIEDGKKLIKDLLKRKEISKKTTEKVILLNCATEDLSSKYGKFDSVCAYEIFEHLAPQDLMPVFNNLFSFIKKEGNFFLSVPNRFPDSKYEKNKRSRWKWFDHRNFFSKAGLELFLSNFFEEIEFFPLYEKEKPEDSIYLICECRKKYEN